MKHLVLAVFALLVVAPTAAATETNTVWRGYPITGGCLIVLAEGAGFPEGEVSWSGVCTPQQPIDGQGVLRIALAPGEYSGAVMTLETVFVGGVPHGDGIFIVLNANGEQVSRTTVTFNMGCVVMENAQPCDPHTP